MLKKIKADQLEVGMYLHELSGSWMDHPFWRSRFKIETAEVLQRIRDSGVCHAWIDTSRGMDIASNASSQDEDEVRLEREQQLEEVATTGLAAAEDVPLVVELEQARAICAKAREAVTDMFQEARMGAAVDPSSVEPLVEEITDSVNRNPQALISVARLKTVDDYTYLHSVAVCGLMVALSRQLGLDQNQTRAAGFAGLLHDVGKAAMPLEVLNKPGRLTEEEFDVMRQHPREGARILEQAGGVDDVTLDVCLHHHERADGGGYPDGLDQASMSLFAKMGAVCDVYDAITSNRPYKEGWDPGEAIRKMTEWSNGHFDRQVFQAFVKSVGIYPVGSLVRLESQRIALVTEQNPDSLLSPSVKLLCCARTRERVPPTIVDLSRPQAHGRIVGWESPSEWGLQSYELFESLLTEEA